MRQTFIQRAASATASAKQTAQVKGATRLRKPPPLSLEHFIQRQRVLTLWRTVLRSLYRIPQDKRHETVAYARGEFERNKKVTDISQIRYLLSTGKTEFEGMSRYIDELAAMK